MSLTPPLRLVRVITWLPVGGIERRLVAALPRLDRALFTPEVVCLRERGPLADDLDAAGIRVTVLPQRSRLSPSGIWRLSRHLREAAIVHSHMYRANVPGTIAARLAKVPAILGHIHNVNTWERPSQVAWDRRTARWRHLTLCVSESVRSNVVERLGLPASRFAVLHNGIDLAPFRVPHDRTAIRERLGVRGGEVAVACLARLHPQKNHLGLLRAISSMPSDLPPWRVILIGDGPARPEIEKQVKALELADHVSLLGTRDDVSDILRACDLAALASEKEGFSNAVLECLAAGLPLVATDVGGNAEAVVEGESGHLVPAGEMNVLGERLAMLIRDGGRRREMSLRARERAEDFDLGSMVRRTERLYLETLHRSLGEGFPAPLREALRERG